MGQALFCQRKSGIQVKIMIETEKLFYQDSYLQAAECLVTACEERERGYAVVLDRTVFYPEGGGQPGDIGTLGDAAVINTIEEGGQILHLTDKLLAPGSTVTARIDFERRFDFMQQHSGEHMVSGLVFSWFGYHNVGFHMGSDVVTIDFDGVLADDDLRKIEAEVNSRIWQNREVEILYPSSEELADMEYRSKKELKGQVRIVQFPGTDSCACCGTHVTRTGEIGMVKILSAVSFRNGVRVEMISGKRVYEYLAEVAEQNKRVSVLLSAKPFETAEAVRRMQEENYRLTGTVNHLQEEMFRSDAERFRGAGNALLFREGLSADNVRKLTDAVMHTCGGRCAVFSDNGDGSFKYAVGEENGDLRGFVKEMNAALSGRGGGKPFFAQGQVRAAESEIRAFFEES